MATFKCKMCGGALEIEGNQTIATCEYCGTQQTLPRLDDERRAQMYDRANHFRRNNEFDKAMGIYEQVLNEDKMDAEAYWSLVLCKYGIEYVEDPESHRHVPTVNRAQFTAIYDDENYQAAIKYSDALQRGIYEAEAKAINEIQKGILAISQNEKPYDVFICYKETDNRGLRTIDSVLAQDIYDQLTNRGLKVFFARITLEDKLGCAYEPYIFAALNSAKVMLVVGTKEAHFNAVWVKNEWSRYLALVGKSRGDKVLIPVYKDMDPYLLPSEFAHLQAQDMNKIGFMQDLVRGIKKVVGENTATSSTLNTQALLERMNAYLEEQDWANAEEYAERVLDIDLKIPEAYIGLLMIELRVSKRDELSNCENSFEENRNYKKAIRYADEKLLAELKGYITTINERKIKAAEERRLVEERKKEELRAKIEKAEKIAKTVAICIAIVSVVLILLSHFVLRPGYYFLNKNYAPLINTYGLREFAVPDNVEEISADMFADCSSLEKLIISESVTCIGVDAFRDCTTLTSVYIPDSVTSIKAGAFEGCISLTDINIPNSVIEIGHRAFAECTSLTSIEIPDSVTSMGNYVFYKCTSLTNVKLSNSVTSIGDSTFNSCSSLTQINIPNSVKEIGLAAFAGCNKLTSIQFPDSVTTIKMRAFAYCYSLTNATIPSSVISVAAKVFEECNKLTVYCEATVQPDEWDDGWKGLGPTVVWGATQQ